MYVCMYVYHISSGINIEHGPHSRMWTVKYVYTANQKRNLGEWSAFYFILKTATERSCLEAAFPCRGWPSQA